MTLATPLSVALGGAAGALLRWGLTEATAATLGRAWTPLATLLANVLGCAVIGFVAARASREEAAWLAAYRPLLVAGFCGALTTFSTFGLEVVDLLPRHPWRAAGLAALHLTLGFLAVAAGSRAGS